ncbi:MAG: hypothetical protein KDA81_09815, partial [Planctomycetaceae bacterium]|nr:hypothetical protein [Planctomycetaceae bacterium]
ANGFDDGKLDAHLPPGYPVFVSAVRVLVDSENAVRIAQIILSILTLLLVWKSTEGCTYKVRFLLWAIIAYSFQAKSLAGAILSETVGLFLSSLCVFVLSRYWKVQFSPLQSFGFGLLLMAATFTCPALAFFCGPIVALILAKHPIRCSAFVVLGCLLLWVPWQLHCINATGNWAPTLFNKRPGAISDSGACAWASTWLRTEDELPFIWYSGDPTLAPRRAFDSDAHKQLFVSKWSNGNNMLEYDQFLRTQAMDRRNDNPWSFKLRPILQRAINTWFLPPKESMPYQRNYLFRFSPASWHSDVKEAGTMRAFLRLSKAWYSTVTAGFYCFSSLLVWTGVCLGVLRGNSLVRLICGGIILYTTYFALSPMGELRRTVPILPFAVLLWVELISMSRIAGTVQQATSETGPQ